MSAPKILVAGLGNYNRPGSLHSYGQTLLHELLKKAAFEAKIKSPVWTLDKNLEGWHSHCPLPFADLYFFKPKTLMNLNGPPIAKAYNHFIGANSKPLSNRNQSPLSLVAIHDQLEQAKTTYRLKSGGSDKGHRGLQSLTLALKTKEYWKMGLGIGRPESRDRYAVAEYVLSPLGGEDLAAVTFSESKKALLLDSAWKDLVRLAKPINE